MSPDSTFHLINDSQTASFETEDDSGKRILLIYLGTKFFSLVTDEIYPIISFFCSHVPPACTKHISDALFSMWLVKVYRQTGRELQRGRKANGPTLIEL